MKALNYRLAGILSLIAFVVLSLFLVIKRLEGHCLHSSYVESISFMHLEEKVSVYSCEGKNNKTKLDYLKYKKFQLIKDHILEADRVLSHIEPKGFSQKIRIEFNEGPLFWPGEKATKIPVSALSSETSFEFIRMVLVSLVFKKNKNLEASLIERLLTSEMISEVLLSSIEGDNILLTKSPAPAELLVRPLDKRKICLNPIRSIILLSICSLNSVKAEDLERLAIQEFVLEILRQKVMNLSPLVKLELISNFRGDWKKFEPLQNIFDEELLRDIISPDQLKWLKEGFKLIYQLIGKSWDISVPLGEIENKTLIKISSDLGKLEGEIIPDSYIISTSNSERVGLSNSGYFIINKTVGIKDYVKFQCHSPFVSDLVKLPEYVQRVTIINYCGEDLVEKVKVFIKSDLMDFLKTNRDMAYFQVHLPSLRWLYKKNAINPFILVEMGNFDHPIFKSIGWANAIYNEDLNSFKVNAAVEVIQQFRPSFNKGEQRN